MTRSLRPFAVGASALLLGTALALGTALPAMADTPPTGAVIDQQQADGHAGPCGPAGLLAQTFTAGVSGLLTTVGVDFPLNFGATSVAVLVEDTSGGNPTGTILSGADSGATTFTGDLNLSSPVRVTAGTQYALVFPANLAGPCAGPTSYTGGTALAFQNGGWINGNANWVFSTYVIPNPTASDTSASAYTGQARGIPLTFTGGATAAVGTAPTHGTVTFSGTTATYTSDPGFTGADTFTYTATNPAGVSDPATVTVTVTPPPPPAPTLAKTGVDSGWLLWPAAGVLLLGIIAVVVAAIVRRRRAAD